MERGSRGGRTQREDEREALRDACEARLRALRSALRAVGATEADLEVAWGFARGMQNAQIAHDRGCSVSAVTKHARKLFRLTRCRDRYELASWANRRMDGADA